MQVRVSNDTLEQSGTLFLAYKAIVRQPADYFVNNRDKLLKNQLEFVMNEEECSESSDRRIQSLFNMVAHERECSMEDRVKTSIRYSE